MSTSMDTQRLKSSKILLIGDACEDVYHYGECTRISPEAPVPIFGFSHSETKPGMALNVKENLIGLGNKVLSLVNSSPISKERYIDQKTMQHMFRVDKGEESRLRPMNPNLLKNLDMSSFDAIVISDYDKGFVDDDTAAAIIKFAKSIPVFADSKKKDLSCYRGCIIKINEQECQDALNVPDGDLVITLGSRGCTWNDMLFEAEKVNVFDVCGAGDTFLASLATGYLSTSDMPFALNFANKCSAIAVSNFGAYTIKLEDLN